MGRQGDNKPPDFSLQKYTDLNIGESFEKTDYCWVDDHEVDCGTVLGEFKKGGKSSSCKCKEVRDKTRNCKNFKCTRDSFKGDPLKCCLGNTKNMLFYYDKSFVGNLPRTCNKIYRTFKGNGCDDTMVKYCSDKDNLFTTECKKWYQEKLNENSSVADNVISTVCNKPEYINKPECGCIFAIKDIQERLPSATSLPVECVHVKCVNEPLALKTLAQSKRDCNIVNCEINVQDLKTVTSGTSPLTTNFSQKCGEQQPTTNPTNPTTNPTTPTTTDTTTSIDFSNNTTVFAIVGVIVILFLMFIAFMALRKN